MTDSEKHRPAVSMKHSKASWLATKLEKADALEEILKAKFEGNEESAKRLSGILGDIIMSNAREAMNHDIVKRLWDVCFYGKINKDRKKISQLKRRKDPGLNRLRKQYQVFCEQGIDLYEYLVNHSHCRLLPPDSQSQTQDSGTQDSISESGDDGKSDSLDGVVECLFLIYIHLGDLYRYIMKQNKAEECYLNAAKLGPGKGNPYNQMAVLTLTGNASMSCNALYWYARSLLATHQAFGTTPKNLERLFVDNRNYMDEHSREPKPPIFKHEQKRKGAYKDNAELERAQKQAANKSFLAHFVALVDDIDKSTDVDEETVRSKMSDILASFESLLEGSTLGDSMLCKIVLLCAFACERSNQSTATSKTLSRDFFLIIGVALASRVERLMRKSLDKDKSPSAIRALLPYAILCEYMSQMEENGGKWHDAFWRRFSEVANLVLQVSRRAGVAPNSYFLDGEINLPLKEYRLLKGYRPFAFLHKKYTEGEAYLSPEDAIHALDLLVSQEERGRNSAIDESNTKLSRLLFVCNEYAENEKYPVAFSDDKYSFVESTLQEDSDAPFEGGSFEGASSPAVSSPAVSSDGDCDDDAGDVVVYSRGEESGAETPPDAPDKATKIPTPQSVATSRNQAMVDIGGNGATPIAPAAETLPPPAALLPPPGFTAPMASPVNMQVSNPLPPFPPQPYTHPGVYGQVVQGTQVLHTPPPPPGMVLPGSMPLQGMPVAGINGNVPFGQAWQVFGASSASMQSANPFASATPAGFGYVKPATPMFEDQHISAEGTSLLDSALIDSLFMNDTKTSNPWK